MSNQDIFYCVARDSEKFAQEVSQRSVRFDVDGARDYATVIPPDTFTEIPHVNLSARPTRRTHPVKGKQPKVLKSRPPGSQRPQMTLPSRTKAATIEDFDMTTVNIIESAINTLASSDDIAELRGADRVLDPSNPFIAIPTEAQWTDYQAHLAVATAMAEIERDRKVPIVYGSTEWYEQVASIDIEATLVDMRDDLSGYPHGKKRNVVKGDYSVSVAAVSEDGTSMEVKKLDERMA